MAAKRAFSRLTGKRPSHASQKDAKLSKKQRTTSLSQSKLLVNRSSSNANPKAASSLKKRHQKTKLEVDSDSSSNQDYGEVKYDNNSDDSLEK